METVALSSIQMVRSSIVSTVTVANVATESISWTLEAMFSLPYAER